MDNIELTSIQDMEPPQWEETPKLLLEDSDASHQERSNGTHSETNFTADSTRSTSRSNASLLIKANRRLEIPQNMYGLLPTMQVAWFGVQNVQKIK